VQRNDREQAVTELVQVQALKHTRGTAPAAMRCGDAASVCFGISV